MLQLKIDQLTGDARTWGGTPVTALVRKWPSKFWTQLKFPVGAVDGQLGGNGQVEFALVDDAGVHLVRQTAFALVETGARAHYDLFVDLATDVVSGRFQADATLRTISGRAEIRWKAGDGADERSVSKIPFTITRADIIGSERRPLPSSATTQSGLIFPAVGDRDGQVVFSQSMLAAPVVGISLLVPAGAVMRLISPEGEITADGFSYHISDEIAAAGCVIFWTAEVLVDADGVVVPGTATRNVQVADLAVGEQDVELVFDPALTATPLIRSLEVVGAEGDTPLFATPTSITATGLTLHLSDAPANANYKLHSNVEVI